MIPDGNPRNPRGIPLVSVGARAVMRIRQIRQIRGDGIARTSAQGNPLLIWPEFFVVSPGYFFLFLGAIKKAEWVTNQVEWKNSTGQTPETPLGSSCAKRHLGISRGGAPCHSPGVHSPGGAVSTDPFRSMEFMDFHET